MLKKTTLLLVCLTFLSIGNAQEYSFEAKISPEKLEEDFSILLSSLRNHHPGLNNYLTVVQFDSLANTVTTSLTDSLTEAQFHVQVRKFIRYIRCGHTVAMPSRNWYDAVKADPKLIPIHVLLKEGELFVRAVFDDQNDGLLGARIISINGVSSSEIILSMKSIIMRDGVGETMVNSGLERLFQTYFMFLYGMKNVYTIQVEQVDGDLIESKLAGHAGKRYTYEDAFELENVLEIPSAKFGILKGSEHLAVLDLASFPRKGYKKFYRKVFKRLADIDSVDLILDLRGNGGGYFPNGNRLLRYILKDRFTMDFSRSNKRFKKNKYMKMDVASRITRVVFNTIPDRNREDPARNYQIRYKPVRRNHFDGKVYVFTDGLTFSAGGFVSSKLKNADRAEIIGEETGGGEVGFNATLSWNLKLPNSGIRVVLPMYHVDIQPTMEDMGRGVVPTMMLEGLFDE